MGGMGRVKRAVGGLKQCINLLENKESKEKLRKKVKENQELKKMLRIKEKENQEAKEEFQTTTSMVKKYCKAEAFQTRGAPVRPPADEKPDIDLEELKEIMRLHELAIKEQDDTVEEYCP